MKYRDGFVSNSSSSSFVVAGKDDEDFIVTARLDVRKYGEEMKSVKDFVAYHGWDEDDLDGNQEEIIKVKNLLAEGKTVVVGSMSDEGMGGNGLETGICENGFKSIEHDLEVIRDCDSY